MLTAFAPTPVTLHGFDIADAVAAITVKLVGYTEVVRCLHSRLGEDAAVVLFGGLAKDHPLSRLDDGHDPQRRHLGVGEDACRRDRPAPRQRTASRCGRRQPPLARRPRPPAVGRTPTKRLVTMADVADATEFLLRNPGVNGHDLALDGGMIIT